MQAIIWLKNKIRCAGAEVDIVVANIVTVEGDTVYIKLNPEGDLMTAFFNTMIAGADMTPNMCLITNSEGGLIEGAADIRSL